MSNRSLIEINHDYAAVIGLNDPVDFKEALIRYLRSANQPHADDLKRFGVRVIGMRHHSDPYRIKWGETIEEDGGS